MAELKLKPLAQEIFDLGGADAVPANRQDLVDFVEQVSGGSDGFWYNLNYGGYIHPGDIYEEGEALDALLDAIELVKEYEETYNGIAFEM